MASLIDSAMFWAEAGVPIFPCKADKRPLTKNGFYDATDDPDKVRALFEFYGDAAVMVGARMGETSGLFAMDFDLYMGDKPKEYMERLISEGHLPESRMHQTMKGGLHVIYRSESSWPNLKPCAGVDVKGEGGYIIVPPSPGYTVLSEGIVTAPSSLINVLAAARHTHSAQSIHDLEAAILEGSDFHDSLLGIAARMSARGATQTDILIHLKKVLGASVASDENHDRYMRWRRLMSDGEKELSRLVKGSFKKFNTEHKSDAARDTAREHQEKWERGADEAGFFSQSPQGGDTEEPAKEYSDEEWPFEKGYFADEDHNLESQEFVMYPIFAENESVVLFAEPKTGKTAVALTTALHIACGFDLGPLKVSSSGPTLYYALEGSRAIRLRVAAWKLKKIEEGVVLPERIPMYVIEGHATFLKEERRNDEANKIIAANNYSINAGVGPLKAVYLDTLTKAMSGGDQNSVEDTSHLFELIGLLRAGGVTATIIFVHHKSRQGNARGSTNIEAEPDVLLDITKEGDIVTMSISRARSIEDGGKYGFKLSGVELGETTQGHPLTGVYITPVDGVEEVGKSSVVEGMLRATQMDVIVMNGEGTFALKAVLADLVKAGCGPVSPKGKPYGAHSFKVPVVQEFFDKLISVTGSLYKSKYAVSLVKTNSTIAHIKVAMMN